MKRDVLHAAVFSVCLYLTPGANAEPAFSRIELLSAVSSVGGGERLLLGVRIEPQPGWKTYWRAPGESGLPPVFLFRAHENAALPEIKWPAPKRQNLQGQESYGYDGPVTFPFFVQPLDTAKPVNLALRVDYAVCRDICVPEQAELTLHLPPGPTKASGQQAALQTALDTVPTPQDSTSSTRIIAATITQQNQIAELHIDAEAETGFVSPDLFVDGVADLLFSAPETTYQDGKRRAHFRLALIYLDPAATAVGQTATLTLVDRDFAIESQVKLAKQSGTE